MSDAREAWCAATMFSGSLCTRPAGHEGHHFHRDPWAEGSPAPREALVALILERFRAAETYMDLPRQAGLLADAILAAGWTPPGEHVKPTLGQVVDALAAQPPGSAEWTSSGVMRAARAVLALFPGRTETEVKAEGWDEGVQAGLDAGLSIAESVHANGGVLDLADVPHAPVNPYRKEADRG